MADTPYEIPNEMRDFAERSVEQARKAFEGFVAVAQKTAGAAEGAARQAQSGATTVGSHMLGYAEQNVNAAFDLAHKLVQAKNPQEALALQNEYLRAQLSALQSQAKEIATLVQNAAPAVKK